MTLLISTSFAAASSGFLALINRVFSSSISPASSRASTMVVTFLATDCVRTLDLLFCINLRSSSEASSGNPTSGFGISG